MTYFPVIQLANLASMEDNNRVSLVYFPFIQLAHLV